MQADLIAAVGMGMSALGVAPGEAVNPLLIEDLRTGSGAVAQLGDRVTLHFVVRTLEGKEIANSRKRGLPYTVELEQEGALWTLLMEGLAPGGKRRVAGNSNLFFGKAGLAPIVPADTEILAEAVLLKVERTLSARKSG